MAGKGMRRGDLVEVRGPFEILATLDESGALDALPFMPEMVGYCGRRFRVDGHINRLCDTVQGTGIRFMEDAVYLEDLRCDGAAHGGCQAECRYYWKEAWLRPVSPGTPAPPPPDPAHLEQLSERAARGVKRARESDGRREERWRCQATDLVLATSPVPLANPTSYARELTSGNVPVSRFAKVMARAVVEEPMAKLGRVSDVHLKGTRDKPLQEPPLNLQPGELVQIKSREEIAETLNQKGLNRGLWFDREMMAYCGKTFRVRQRITRFINDQDGQMIELKSDSVTLDGAVCSGDLSLHRWFCARGIYPFWREIWLRRVEEAPPSSGS